MHEPILSDWTPRKISDFGRATIQLCHRLDAHPLFRDDALIKLLEQVNSHDYQLNTMDISRHDPSTRLEGELGDVSGRDILRAVEKGHIWILLMHPHKLDPRYRSLLEDIFAEFSKKVPAFKPYLLNMAILISSPRVQVYYHLDIPGQMLWQLRGQKRIYIYPNREPFIDRAYLETTALGETHECGMPYQESYDREAVVYDLQPGQMLHWPLNAPHRIVNGNSVNVSLATEHFTTLLRRTFYVNYANGVLHKQRRSTELAQNIHGLAYWAKLCIAAAYKLSGAQKRHKRTPNIQFRVDPEAPNGVRPKPPSTFKR